MRIELTPSAWKAEVLPLNYIRTIKNWSGRRDSNSRPSPWQGDALPLSHFRISYSFFKIGRGRWIRTIESSANGFTVRPLWPLGNPSMYACLFFRLLCHLRSHRYSSTIVHSVPRSLDFAHSDKNPAHKIVFFSDCFVIFDRVGEQKFLINGAGGGNRTPNLLITNQLLYR